MSIDSKTLPQEPTAAARWPFEEALQFHRETGNGKGRTDRFFAPAYVVVANGFRDEQARLIFAGEIYLLL